MIGNIIATIIGFTLVLFISILIAKAWYKDQGNTGAQDYHEVTDDLGKAWRDIGT